MRDENSRAVGAKPSWSTSLMWCARCHSDLVASRDQIPVIQIFFRVHRSGPNAKSVDSSRGMQFFVRKFQLAAGDLRSNLQTLRTF
jgi:hypothetical protein